jgi:hypothetical protein
VKTPGLQRKQPAIAAKRAERGRHRKSDRARLAVADLFS